jgi:hypothetical protein
MPGERMQFDQSTQPTEAVHVAVADAKHATCLLGEVIE